MLSKLKSQAQARLAPLAKRIPLSPNAISVLSILCMLAAAYLILKQQLLAAGLLVILSGFLDLLDGEVARTQKKATDFGNWLDKVADRINDALLFGSIVLSGLVNLWQGLLALIMVLLGSYISLAIDVIITSPIYAKRRAIFRGTQNVGSSLSMRGIRLLVVAIGLIAVQVPAAIFIVIILAAIAISERIVTAIRLLR